MTMWGITALCAGTMLGSWALAGAFRSYAVRRGMLDLPNERSLHVEPTPRGGGAAIVLATLGALCVLGLAGTVSWTLVAGFAGAGSIVAVAGFLDDRKHLRKRWRLLSHFAAASIVLIALGGIPPIVMFDGVLSSWATVPIAMLSIVWLINLTNFMDGIDGIAAGEAVSVSVAGALLHAPAAPQVDGWTVPLVFAAAAGGFLIWNRPPARIFMGDVGSGFVGLWLAAMSLHASTISPSLFWGWPILLGVFVVDASMTLIRRLLRGERVWNAHRTHAYQHAAIRWQTHRGVTLAVVGINLFWLLPLAWLVVLDRIDPITGTVVAYAPLIVAASRRDAGRTAPGSVHTRSAR